VTFTVQDDGPGVAEQNRERIFEPGWRDRSGRQPNGHGAGLGLPLARRLARAAGGDVDAEPDAAGGLLHRAAPVWVMRHETGLGRAQASAIGAKLTLTNEPDGGACARLTLPET
jgi:signal transduction histidine kinase